MRLIRQSKNCNLAPGDFAWVVFQDHFFHTSSLVISHLMSNLLPLLIVAIVTYKSESFAALAHPGARHSRGFVLFFVCLFVLWGFFFLFFVLWMRSVCSPRSHLTGVNARTGQGHVSVLVDISISCVCVCVCKDEHSLKEYASTSVFSEEI